jgi:predicted DNA-binding transcriptional regulator YafY
MIQTEICRAIQSRQLLRFHYTGNDATGHRVVEPHMLAYNQAGNLALSAWFVSGASQSQEGPGWREYLLDEISEVIVLPEMFAAARFGYKRDGGSKFHNVQCAL